MRRTSRTNRSESHGFTIIEVLVVAPIVIITITGVIVLLVNLVQSNLASRGELTVTYDINAAFSGMEDDIRVTSQFLETQDDNFNDPYGMGTAAGDNHVWNYTGSTSDGVTRNVLITRAYATDRSIRDSQKRAVYVNEDDCISDGSVRNCPALTINLVYFVRNNNLYRRTLMDERYLNGSIDTYVQTSTGAVATDPFQRQSCPPDRSDNDEVCGANDQLLVSDIEEFTISYFTADNTSATSPEEATSVETTITVDRRIAGQTFAVERTLRAYKLN